MARPFRKKILCPTCGTEYPLELPFEAWFRSTPDLAKFDLVRFDNDMIIHRYNFSEDRIGQREVQALMFVEVKRGIEQMDIAQADTLWTLGQVLRNRQGNMHAKRKYGQLRDHVPLARCYSLRLNRKIAIRLYGAHLLQLSGEDPIVSKSMRWDGKAISYEDLVQILRFERDPDTLRFDKDWWRRRHPPRRQLALPVAPIHERKGGR
jgi:hypothetical protein